MNEVNTISQSPVPDSNNKAEGSLLVSFYDAIRAVAKGKSITRVAWQDGSIAGYLKDNKLMINLTTGEHIWIVSLEDMVAEDWVIINE